MSEHIPDEEYTFQDALVEASKLSIPAQMTGLGLRLELSDKESVRCATPLVARETLSQVREARIEAEVAKMDAAFAKLNKLEDAYRRNFGPIPPITERKRD